MSNFPNRYPQNPEFYNRQLGLPGSLGETPGVPITNGEFDLGDTHQASSTDPISFAEDRGGADGASPASGPETTSSVEAVTSPLGNLSMESQLPDASEVNTPVISSDSNPEKSRDTDGAYSSDSGQEGVDWASERTDIPPAGSADDADNNDESKKLPGTGGGTPPPTEPPKGISSPAEEPGGNGNKPRIEVVESGVERFEGYIPTAAESAQVWQTHRERTAATLKRHSDFIDVFTNTTDTPGQ